MMPGREYQAQPSRFGFNGKENDHDVKGFGNQQDYGFRIYDTRIGKFLSVDPLTQQYPWYTPYQFSGSSPIANVDLDGAEPKDAVGNYEGEKLPTKETRYGARGSYVVEEIWYWHTGGAGTGQYTCERNAKGETISQAEILTKGGWYTSTGYVNVLASTTAAKTLAVEAGYTRFISPGAISNESLSKFVGEGLNENAAEHLNAAAYKIGTHANFMASGYTEQGGFNVEDMLGVGLIFKFGFRAIGSYAMKNISYRLASNPALKNTVDDFVRLFKPINEYDVTKTFYRGTTGSEGKGNLFFLTDDAKVAATYVKNGGQVMKYDISNSALFNLRQRGLLTLKEDIHKIGSQEIRHTTYEFTGSNLRQALNSIAVPNQ